MKIKKIGRWSLLLLLLGWMILEQSCARFRTSDTSARKKFEAKGLSIAFSEWRSGESVVHWAQTGNDTLPTLFFVHGSPGSWHDFEQFMADSALRRRFRMISVDRPGFGYSRFGHAEHLQAQAQAIGALAAQVQNGKPLHLVGHSIGGPVVMQLAQDNPSLYASLCVLAGSISPFDEPKEKWRTPFTYFPLKYLLPGAFRPSNLEIVYFKKDLFLLDSGYARVTMPVTFIHGDKDGFVTVKNVAYGEAKLSQNPQVKSIIIPGADHFIPWTHYEIIKQYLLTL